MAIILNSNSDGTWTTTTTNEVVYMTTTTTAAQTFLRSHDFHWDEELKIINLEAWWTSDAIPFDGYDFSPGKNWLVLPL